MTDNTHCEYTADEWCKYGAFGVDPNYKEKPEYILAQEFWLDKKAELLEEYKYCNSTIAQFIKNITVMQFFDEPIGLYKISLIVKSCYEGRQTLANSHEFVDLFYDTRPGEITHNITISTFDWFTYDLYEDFIRFDPTYIKDEEHFAGNLCKEYIKSMHWEGLPMEDVSYIFTSLFRYYTAIPLAVGVYAPLALDQKYTFKKSIAKQHLNIYF